MSRVLWDADLEAAVLGAALSHPDAARLVVERCRPDDFYRETNRRVLAEVARLLAAGQRPDSVIAAQAVEPEHRPDVLALPSYCPVVVNVALYVTRLQRVAARRRLGLAVEKVEAQVETGIAPELRAELVAAASDERVEEDAQ